MIKSLINKLNENLTSIPEVVQKPRLPGLDGLRGFSIILVIISHVFRGTVLDNYPIGTIGVFIFFVISGFLITTLLLKEKINSRNISLKNFYMRRVLRIIPASFFFLIVLSILNFCFSLSITFLSFVTAILYLKNLPIHNGGEWFTGHFWTLSVEEQFYLIFPFLLTKNINRYTVIIFFIIMLIPLIQFLGYKNVFNLQSNTIIHIVVFGLINLIGKGTVCILIGSLFSILTFKKVIVINQFKLPYWGSFMVFISTIFLFTFINNTYLSPILFSILMSFIILNNLSQNSLLVKLLENKLLVKIGVLSYSIYMWQQIFTYYQPWRSSFTYANSIALNLIALLLVSIFSHYCIELPFLKLKNKFKAV